MPGPRPFDAYLFDLDGTLIDSTALIMASFRHTMERHLGTVPSEADWRRGFGTPLRTQLARFARHPDDVPEMAATYVAHNREHHDGMVTAFPGVRQLLDTLTRDERSSRLAIVTSKNRVAMRRGLELCGLADYFSETVTVDDVAEFKPHPAPVLEALSRLEADAATTLFVGDSPHDVAAGRAAGVRTAVALWGPFSRGSFGDHRPDHWAGAPDEIARLPREGDA